MAHSLRHPFRPAVAAVPPDFFSKECSAMANPDVQQNQPRFPRIISSGVDYSDLLRVVERCNNNNEQWPKVWEEYADLNEQLGDEALRDGRTITAGEAYARAAVYLHTAQANHTDLPEKERLQKRQHAAYFKAMPYLRPPVQALDIPFRDSSFPGYLRLPENARGPAPCVLLCAGLDSTKEELATVELEFLKRGLATFNFDGPGQSLTRTRFPLAATIEQPVAAILDVLQRRADLDPARFAVWGRSFGGYTAPRAAALEPRLKACVSIGGFYDCLWECFRPASKQEFAVATRSANLEKAEKVARTFTMKGIIDKVTVPLLIVHSHGDIVCPVADAERMAREAKGPVHLALYPEGNHVCDNIPYKVRPLMADWLARQLGQSTTY